MKMKAILKSRNRESKNGMRGIMGMRGTRMGMQGIGVRMRGSRVGMREIEVEMQGIRVGM